MPGAAPVALERVTVGINRPLQLRASSRASGSRLVWAAVLLLLLVALGIGFWPKGSELPWDWRSIWVAASNDAASEPAPQMETVLRPDLPVQAPAEAKPISAKPVVPASAPLLAVASAPEPLAPAAEAVTEPAPAQRTPNLTVRAKESTWVSITDASGASLVARMLPAGETIELDIGQGPVRVVLGNAPGAELNWRGQVQDLTAYQAARVARLTLN
jgi:cytoskeleton protein RodZ